MLVILDGGVGGYWGARVNFVDENNVLVGFDMSQSCCEDFGWKLTRDINGKGKDLGYDGLTIPYHFNTEFVRYDMLDREYYDEGHCVTFKLVHDNGGAVMYLHLWNYHNGYYAHGFNFQIGKGEDREIIEEGYL